MLPPDGVRRATRLLCVLALLAIEVLFGAKVDNALSHCLGSDALGNRRDISGYCEWRELCWTAAWQTKMRERSYLYR